MVHFPPVTVFLRGCLPFANGPDLLLKIAATWGEAVGCTSVSIARWDESIRQLEFFSRANGDEWDEFTVTHRWLPVCGGTDAGAVVANQHFPASGQTFELGAAGTRVGWLHVCHTQHIEAVPRDWLDQTSRLVKQAGIWSESLRSQKLAALAEYAAGAGHEVNNPLAAISGRVQQLLAVELEPERKRILETIVAQTLRIRDMMGDSMLFARPPAAQPTAVSWQATWQNCVDRLQPLIDEKALQVTSRGADATLLADVTQFTVAVCELLRNAIEASLYGQTIACKVSTSGDQAHLVISDQGRGLNEQEREHLFDPFYSGRQAGRGLGFGLSKAWRIAQQHNAQLVCHTSAHGGVEMHLHWPLAAENST